MQKLSCKDIKPKAHFLHIGKTAGSAIKIVLENNLETEKYNLVIHNHATSIEDIPVGEKIVFFFKGSDI